MQTPAHEESTSASPQEGRRTARLSARWARNVGSPPGNEPFRVSFHPFCTVPRKEATGSFGADVDVEVDVVSGREQVDPRVGGPEECGLGPVRHERERRA